MVGVDRTQTLTGAAVYEANPAATNKREKTFDNKIRVRKTR